MPERDYDSCETRILVHEGGTYTDGVHPYDPGGPTRWGVTIADARKYWKANATADDVRTMPIEAAKTIIRGKYWLHPNVRGDVLSAGVDDCVFDYAYNSGVGRAGKVLRRVLGMADTSALVDQAVLAELARRDPRAVVNAICDERLRFLQGLAIWPTYKNGWTTRVREVRAFSLQLVETATQGASMPEAPAPNPEVQQAPKGMVPPPTTAKKIVKTAGAGATIGLGGVVHWLGAHPVATGAIVIGSVTAIGGAIYYLDQRHAAKQEAPTPGLVPVPLAA